MELLLDIGNTRLKWRWMGQGRLLAGGAEPLPPAGREAALFSRLWGTGAVPGRVVVSNVAGEQVLAALREWSIAAWGRTPEVVAPAAAQGTVANGYREPAALGVDRWCTLIGARTLSRGELCVVGCGTAITLDLLGADGRHAGGVIMPGIQAMATALTRSTRGIRVESLPVAGAAPLGRTTAEGIGAGLLAAAAGMVDHTLERVAFPADGLLLITGGDAVLVASALRRPLRVEPDLLFLGLAEAAGGLR